MTDDEDEPEPDYECGVCGAQFDEADVQGYQVFRGEEYVKCPECGQPWQILGDAPWWARKLAPLVAVAIIVFFLPLIVYRWLKRLFRWVVR